MASASESFGSCPSDMYPVIKTVDTRSCFLQNEALMSALRNWRTFAVPMCV